MAEKWLREETEQAEQQRLAEEARAQLVDACLSWEHRYEFDTNRPT
jgi:hypothetical protein